MPITPNRFPPPSLINASVTINSTLGLIPGRTSNYGALRKPGSVPVDYGLVSQRIKEFRIVVVGSVTRGALRLFF